MSVGVSGGVIVCCFRVDSVSGSEWRCHRLLADLFCVSSCPSLQVSNCN